MKLTLLGDSIRLIGYGKRYQSCSAISRSFSLPKTADLQSTPCADSTIGARA